MERSGCFPVKSGGLAPQGLRNFSWPGVESALRGEEKRLRIKPSLAGGVKLSVQVACLRAPGVLLIQVKRSRLLVEGLLGQVGGLLLESDMHFAKSSHGIFQGLSPLGKARFTFPVQGLCRSLRGRQVDLGWANLLEQDLRRLLQGLGRARRIRRLLEEERLPSAQERASGEIRAFGGHDAQHPLGACIVFQLKGAERLVKACLWRQRVSRIVLEKA